MKPLYVIFLLSFFQGLLAGNFILRAAPLIQKKEILKQRVQRKNITIHEEKNNSGEGPEEKIKNLPLSFRKNEGQWNENICFKGSSQSWNASINFLKNGLSFGFCIKEKNEFAKDFRNPETRNNHTPLKYLVWNLHFVGVNPGLIVNGEGKEYSHANYFLGNDKSKYRTNVPDYRLLLYKNIYHNIDLKYYSSGKNLKYDYVVKPGGKIENIVLSCEGIKKLKINEENQLEIETEWGILVEEIPLSFQIINGEKKIVEIGYRIINDSTFGFNSKNNYNPSFPLIIDPVNLQWSTYIQGTSFTSSGTIEDIAVDASGNVYATGNYNGDFPTVAGSYDVSFNGVTEVFVLKMNSTGTGLIFSTYIGGSSAEEGEGIAVNSKGEVFISGATVSTNFPTTAGAYSTVKPGLYYDMFVAKLDSSGSNLLYSTYLGGNNPDEAQSIAVNDSGKIYITGYTQSNDFPVTPGSFNSVFTGGADLVVAKINPANAGMADLVFSTFIGPGFGEDIAVNNMDECFVSGASNSWNFPTTAGVISPTINSPGSFNYDAVILRLNANGTSLIFSTFLGGSQGDEGASIAINNSNETFITGYCGSGFPVTPGSFDTTTTGNDSYVCKINSSGTALIYSTFLGGDNTSEITGSIAINSLGEAYVAGNTLFFNTDSTFDFPTTPGAYDSTVNLINPSQNNGDYFISKLNSSGSQLNYSTLISGSDAWEGNSLYPSIAVLDIPCKNAVFMGGSSGCTDFPTTPGSFQPIKTASSLGYQAPVLLQLGPSGNFPDFTVDSTISNCSTTYHFNIIPFDQLNPNTYPEWDPVISFAWDFGDNSTGIGQSVSHIYNTDSAFTVTLFANSCGNSKTINVSNPMKPFFSSISKSDCICNGDNSGSASVVVSGGASPYIYSWAPTGGTNPNTIGLMAGKYYCAVTDANSCTIMDSIIITDPPYLGVTSSSTPDYCGHSNGTATVIATGGIGGYTYVWNNAAGNQSTATATGLQTGDYDVAIYDSLGCNTGTNVVVIKGGFFPPATIGLTPTTIKLGSTALLNVNGGDEFKWYPSTGLSCDDCSNPIASPVEKTEYCVIVKENTHYCNDTVCITISVENEPCAEIFVPTAFSPNNDGKNDFECILGGCIESLQFLIFDRWGEKVFETNDQKVCWDGNFKGKPMNTAVFVYSLSLVLTNGEKITQKGNINLLR